MSDFDLIIYDCDGTLTDTETLYAQVTCELLHDNGLSMYTPEKCLESFQGKTWAAIRNKIESDHDIKLCDDIVERYAEQAKIKLEKSLQPVAGALELLQSTSETHEICVGSNGERSNVLASLYQLDFVSFFTEEKIYTKCQVENGKPEPDLFLYAAEKMGHTPERTLVIEDSVPGVHAGVAAGMHVIGFTGSAHDVTVAESRLKEAGAHTIMQELIHIIPWLKSQKTFDKSA
ncbi:MAG: HAD family phosphatase [Pseudomonadota bacterium]